MSSELERFEQFLLLVKEHGCLSAKCGKFSVEMAPDLSHMEPPEVEDEEMDESKVLYWSAQQ